MSAEHWSVTRGVARQLADAQPDGALPLVVDLDGALLKVDALHETLIALLLRRPWQGLLALLVLMTRGRAAMNARIAAYDALDVDALPLREDVLAWLQGEVVAGRELHLISAADQAIVERFAQRLQLFESCIGSNGSHDLQGSDKAAWLRHTFPQGFRYLSKPDEADFPVRNGAAVLLEQLRLHQWSKNVLVFLPLLLAHRFTDLRGWLHVLLVFGGMGLVASATYLVNDLSDLADDRRHATKRNRPLAAGAFPSIAAVTLVPFLLAAGFALTFAASSAAAVVLATYVVLTLAYSFRLKRIPLLDTAVIGLLFTLRIVLGAAAVRTPPSPWLLAFSVMLFFSLAMAKRQSEIAKASSVGDAAGIARRGYEPGDVVLTLVYGIASGVASLVISMLYITNGVATELYGNPNWLWAVPLLLYLWQMRVWLLAHRGILDDDPIVFALKDKASLALAAGCMLALYMAL